jgi:hypothetical protein
MDYDEVNRELNSNRNSVSDYVKAINDAEWRRIIEELSGGVLESPQDALELPPEEKRTIYHDHGVKPPASPTEPQGPSIFVSPWVYHEIQAVLAECDAIERVENTKKTRWARLRKIDKMRRKTKAVNDPVIYTTYTTSTSVTYHLLLPWIT